MAEYHLTYDGFKEGLKEGKLLGLACSDCGAVTAPPNAVCTTCGSARVQPKPLAKIGKIKTFTVIRVSPKGFNPPYIVALVELNDGPWVMGNLVGLDPNNVTIDLIETEVIVTHAIIPLDANEGGIQGATLLFTPVS